MGNDTITTNPQSWNLYHYVRNNPYRYVDRNGKQLFVVINGQTFKVVRNGSSVSLVGDGDRGTSRFGDTLSLLRKFDGFAQFTERLTNIINSSVISTVYVDGDAGNPGSTMPGTSGMVVSSTVSGVGISGVDDQSFINLGTELLVVESMLEMNAWAIGSQEPGGKLALSPAFGLPDGTLERTGDRWNFENSVREALGLERIDRGQGQFSSTLPFPTESTVSPGSGRTTTGDGGGLSTGPPVPDEIPLPPPPPRPVPTPKKEN